MTHTMPTVGVMMKSTQPVLLVYLVPGLQMPSGPVEGLVEAVGGVGEAALVADAGFACGADLGVGAVDDGPEEAFEAGLAVTGVAPLQAAVGGAVLDLDVGGDGALHGMADVVDDEGVAIIPAAHIELLHGG